jgi:hypothetical protein
MAAMNDENAPPPLQKTVSANQMGVSFLSKERQQVAEASRTTHEEAVAAAKGAELVEAWDAYLEWAELHPDGAVEAHSASMRSLLIRCIGALAGTRDRDAEGQPLRRSLRALIVVITHVDACRDPDAIAVFEAMYTNSLGVGRSLLYEGWAVILERSKNYTGAEEIFQIGLNNAGKACEDAFEPTLRKALRELVRRRRKRGVPAGQGAPATKKARKRAEKKGYVQELLATDDGDEMSFEEWRLMRYTFVPAGDSEPECSPQGSLGSEPTTTVDSRIGQLMPSPAAAPSPAEAAAAPSSGFAVFVDEASPAAAAAPAVADVPVAADEPAAQPTPSPVQQPAAAAAAAALTPTRDFGAQTDKLTARDVFSSLQLPPEAMVENVMSILEAIVSSDACAHIAQTHCVTPARRRPRLSGCCVECCCSRILASGVVPLFNAATRVRSARACW